MHAWVKMIHSWSMSAYLERGCIGYFVIMIVIMSHEQEFGISQILNMDMGYNFHAAFGAIHVKQI